MNEHAELRERIARLEHRVQRIERDAVKIMEFLEEILALVRPPTYAKPVGFSFKSI